MRSQCGRVEARSSAQVVQAMDNSRLVKLSKNKMQGHLSAVYLSGWTNYAMIFLEATNFSCNFFHFWILFDSFVHVHIHNLFTHSCTQRLILDGKCTNWFQQKFNCVEDNYSVNEIVCFAHSCISRTFEGPELHVYL